MPAPLFAKVANILDFPAEEREVLRFWRGARIFEKTLSKPAPRGTFIFYEGPPTANGMPHNGHVLTRVIKDLFPRYKTMRGWSVPRKAGWDTHGLPVEVEVEKELRIHGKAAIEAYGVEPFVKKCRLRRCNPRKVVNIGDKNAIAPCPGLLWEMRTDEIEKAKTSRSGCKR